MSNFMIDVRDAGRCRSTQVSNIQAMFSQLGQRTDGCLGRVGVTPMSDFAETYGERDSLVSIEHHRRG
jgi:hypothetical protein